MLENLHSEFSQNDIAQYVKVHPGHISRIFSKKYHGGYDAWLKYQRVHHAKKIIINQTITVQKCANLCGISNVSWFIKCFKEETSMTPGQFQHSHI
jgi:two-component system, response regulator YesN